MNYADDLDKWHLLHLTSFTTDYWAASASKSGSAFFFYFYKKAFAAVFYVYDKRTKF